MSNETKLEAGLIKACCACAAGLENDARMFPDDHRRRAVRFNNRIQTLRDAIKAAAEAPEPNQPTIKETFEAIRAAGGEWSDEDIAEFAAERAADHREATDGHDGKSTS